MAGKVLPSVVMSMAGQVLEQVQPLFMLISTRNTAGPASVVDLSQHISCWNNYGGWYDTHHITCTRLSFRRLLQSYKGSLTWNNVTHPFPSDDKYQRIGYW
ncbi:fimbrial protein [Escherichia coli]